MRCNHFWEGVYTDFTSLVSTCHPCLLSHSWLLVGPYPKFLSHFKKVGKPFFYCCESIRSVNIPYHLTHIFNEDNVCCAIKNKERILLLFSLQYFRRNVIS